MINSSSSIPAPSLSSMNPSDALSLNSATSMGQDVYTDLTGLKKINLMADTDKSSALKELSKQFESIFINLMLKTMRESNAVFEEGGLFNSSEMKFHRESFDNQLALNLSNQGGIGLADAFYQQMHRQYEATSSDKLSSIDGEKAEGVGTLLNKLDKYFDLKEKPVATEVKSKFNPLSNEKETVINGSSSLNSPSKKLGIHQVDNDLPAFDSSLTTPKTFVDYVYPHAKEASEKLGIDPKMLVAQAALETGWGKHVISNQQGESSNNIFNIKADGRWKGDQISVQTLEYRDGIAKKESANFRQYASVVDSFNDYVSFIQNQPRYQQALKTTNPTDYIQSLQDSGYATDPNYANKVMRIFNADVVQTVNRDGVADNTMFSNNTISNDNNSNITINLKERPEG